MGFKRLEAKYTSRKKLMSEEKLVLEAEVLCLKQNYWARDRTCVAWSKNLMAEAKYLMPETKSFIPKAKTWPRSEMLMHEIMNDFSESSNNAFFSNFSFFVFHFFPKVIHWILSKQISATSPRRARTVVPMSIPAIISRDLDRSRKMRPARNLPDPRRSRSGFCYSHCF